MSDTRLSTLTLNRASVTLRTDVKAQIENMTQQEAAYWGGAGPHFRYWIFPLAIYDIEQGDQLIDPGNVDPKTNSGFREYRVIDDPEPFPDSHMELVADRVRGK
jgi:hypothetical protein